MVGRRKELIHTCLNSLQHMHSEERVLAATKEKMISKISGGKEGPSSESSVKPSRELIVLI